MIQMGRLTAERHYRAETSDQKESVGKLGDICQASPAVVGRSAVTSVSLPEAKQIAAVLLRAIHDPAIRVRAEAVRSLAYVGLLAGIDPGPIKEAVENDPAIEVRAAAIGALFTGWPEHSRNHEASSCFSTYSQ